MRISPPRLSRMLRKTLKLSVIIYVLLCTITYFAQDWLAFPAHAYQGKPVSVIRPERDSQILHFSTKTGDQITALFGAALLPTGEPDPDSAHRPTILYFYGNGGAVAWSMGEFDQFRRLDANVLIPDLPGYGMSTGKPNEQAFYAAADAAYENLVHRDDIDPRQIIPLGWSMGAAVAIDLASRKPVAGIATFNAFTDFHRMARLALPYIPTGLFVKYRFDNLQKMPLVKIPAFICNGQQDTLVPPTMSDQLASAAGGRVTRLIIATADHNTIFIAKPKDLFAALKKFVEEVHVHPQAVSSN